MKRYLYILVASLFCLSAITSYAYPKGKFKQLNNECHLSINPNGVGGCVMTVDCFDPLEINSSGKYTGKKIQLCIENIDSILLVRDGFEKAYEKYAEWKKVAIDNNIKEFGKIVDFRFPKCVIEWEENGETISSKAGGELKLVFVVMNGQYVLESVNAACGWNKYGESTCTGWCMMFMSEAEIRSFIDAIEEYFLYWQEMQDKDKLFK